MPIHMSRRQLLAASASSGGLLGLGGHWTTVFGQSQPQLRPAEQLEVLENRARQIGLPAPTARAVAPLEERETYSELLPRLVDLIDRADAGGQGGTAIAEETAELLGRVHRAERSLAPEDEVPACRQAELRGVEPRVPRSVHEVRDRGQVQGQGRPTRTAAEEAQAAL